MNDVPRRESCNQSDTIVYKSPFEKAGAHVEGIKAIRTRRRSSTPYTTLGNRDPTSTYQIRTRTP